MSDSAVVWLGVVGDLLLLVVLELADHVGCESQSSCESSILKWLWRLTAERKDRDNENCYRGGGILPFSSDVGHVMINIEV